MGSSLVVASRVFLGCGVQASPEVASLLHERIGCAGFRSCDTRALEHRLNSSGARA